MNWIYEILQLQATSLNLFFKSFRNKFGTFGTFIPNANHRRHCYVSIVLFPKSTGNWYVLAAWVAVHDDGGCSTAHILFTALALPELQRMRDVSADTKSLCEIIKLSEYILICDVISSIYFTLSVKCVHGRVGTCHRQ